jgi:SMODS-associated and fused to various effectors sensor domain
MQRGDVWSSEEAYSESAVPIVAEHAIDQGEDLAVAIEVATPIADDVMRWIREQRIPARRLVSISPASGPRDNAVAGAADACALAVGIREAVRTEVKGCPRVHLFLATPMGLALLLGHRWNRVAPTVVYEDLGAVGYDAAFTVTA